MQTMNNRPLPVRRSIQVPAPGISQAKIAARDGSRRSISNMGSFVGGGLVFISK